MIALAISLQVVSTLGLVWVLYKMSAKNQDLERKNNLLLEKLNWAELKIQFISKDVDEVKKTKGAFVTRI